MNEPRRLIHDDPDPELAALLATARDDTPRDDDRLAVAASIGLAIGAPAALGAGSTPGAQGPWAVMATPAAKAIGMLAMGAVIGLGSMLATKARGPSVPEVTAQAASHAVAPIGEPLAPPAAPGEEGVHHADTPEIAGEVARPTGSASIDDAHPAAPVPRGEKRAHAASAADLARETELLAQAKGAIAEHRFGDASRALDAYAHEAPRGVLAQEARALGVQLLVARGDRSAAIEAARAFLTAFPSSPYAARMGATLRELGGDDEAPPR